MRQVLISGGSGMIGSKLSRMLLAQGDSVFILSTQKQIKKKVDGAVYVYWDPSKNYIDPSFQSADCHIINLAGAGIAEKRWTPERKKEIVASRVQSLSKLFEAVKSGQLRPGNLVSASAIGYYGETDTPVTEDRAGDNSFLSQTCQQWEAEASGFRALDIPTAIVRIGIVLSSDGGALSAFLKSVNVGLAAIPGDGRQIMSWVHIEDLCRVILFLMDHEENETYNAVADEPVSANSLFEAILSVKKAIPIHIPSYVLKWVMGEMGQEILKSACISNDRIKKAGFDFRYKTIQPAINELLGAK